MIKLAQIFIGATDQNAKFDCGLKLDLNLKIKLMELYLQILELRNQLVKLYLILEFGITIL